MQRVEVARAALANARWCEAMCRSHAMTGVFDADAWTCPQRTPALHPDAVTLVPDVDVDQLLTRIDATAGCSVKDSYATLDLRDHGFEVLFVAQWILRERVPVADPPASPGSLAWRPIAAHELGAWEQAWASDGGPTGVFRPRLLTEEIVVLGRFAEGRVHAGGILNAGEGVVGLSNVFGPDAQLETTWRDCAAAIDALHPADFVVGYESGASVAAACGVGFRPLGQLRVWSR